MAIFGLLFTNSYNTTYGSYNMAMDNEAQRRPIAWSKVTPPPLSTDFRPTDKIAAQRGGVELKNGGILKLVPTENSYTWNCSGNNAMMLSIFMA